MPRRDETAAVWALLAAQPSVLGDVRIRETGLTVPAGSVLLGLDVDGGRHLLVPVSAGEPVREDRTSRGVHLIERTLLDRGQSVRFLDVVCRAAHLGELFDVLVDEMLDALERRPASSPGACVAVLERWRELLERERGPLLGAEQLAALLAELWHLRGIVDQDEARRIDCWGGPRGDRHDFRRGALALEVKATLAREGLMVEIHGQEQLEPPERGELYLAAMKLERIDRDGLTVPTLVRDLLGRGVDRQALLALLERAGYRLGDSAAYERVQFLIREHRLYLVDQAFPRIVGSSFAGGAVPPGVLRLRYHVDLTGESPAARPPGEIEMVLRRLAA